MLKILVIFTTTKICKLIECPRLGELTTDPHDDLILFKKGENIPAYNFMILYDFTYVKNMHTKRLKGKTAKCLTYLFLLDIQDNFNFLMYNF